MAATKAYKRIYVATYCARHFPQNMNPKSFSGSRLRFSDSKNKVELLVEYMKITNRRNLKLKVHPSAALINKRDLFITISYVDDLDTLQDRFDSQLHGLISI